MARSTFKVLFYVKRQSEKSGQVPVMGRITINGTISQFSCKLSVSPKLWDTKANKASGKSVAAQRINEQLENIKTNIGKQYQRLCDRDSYVTAEKVKNAWLGFGDGYQLLMQTFDEYLTAFGKRVGRDRAIGTLIKYNKSRRYLAAFLQYEYGSKDIPFRELKRDFIEKFVVYLSSVRNMLPGSIHTPVKKLKLMTYTVFKNGWITADPFAGFHINVTYRDRRFLSEPELCAVMNIQVPNYKTAIVRDIFVFCCFTGLAYVDVDKLTCDDIHTDEQGDMWIIDKRQKTGTQFRVKLLPVAKQLVERYRHLRLPNGKVFPTKDRNSMNMSLRHVAKHTGLSFNPTMHMARHTFATTVTLTQGVPLETVSKMLGHKRITTTQIYARITNDKIGKDMDALSEKLEGKFRMAR